MTTFEELGSQHLSGSRNRDVQMLVGKRGEGSANDVSKITIQNGFLLGSVTEEPRVPTVVWR